MNSSRMGWSSCICFVALIQPVALAQDGPDSLFAPGKKPPLGNFDFDRHPNKSVEIQILDERKVIRDFREAPDSGTASNIEKAPTAEKHWTGVYQSTTRSVEVSSSLTPTQPGRGYVNKMIITEQSDKKLEIRLWIDLDAASDAASPLLPPGSYSTISSEFSIETQARPYHNSSSSHPDDILVASFSTTKYSPLMIINGDPNDSYHHLSYTFYLQGAHGDTYFTGLLQRQE
ncbi:MAG: hypothetical protein P4L53_22645 [Candidatus Obscuribacterales bacterium]|nr:hypothetical protein [Candidatus Obscuribacterales bacterium]